MSYVIEATYEENGTRLHCDSHYACGDWAHHEFATREEAEEIMAELQADVGDVVDASVEYEIVER